jgi:hypothetical protein
MDELTLLREFQSGVPGPSAAETAAARDLLAAAINTEAAPVAQPGADRAGGPVRRDRAARRRRRFWLPAAGVTCAAAVAIAAVAVLEPGHRPVRPVPAPAVQTAAFVLHQAASAAAAQAAGHGRYFVSESEYIDPGNGQDAPAKRTIWIGNGVSGRLVQGHAPAAAITPGISFGRRTISWAQLRDLPTRPGQLLAEIARVSANLGQPLPVAEFSTITGLLFESPTPPALRAALYLAAARLPGVAVVRDAHDLLGRSADEVYIRPGFAGNDGQALFFDPSTSAVLGLASIVGTQLSCPPSSEYAVLASGYVASKYQLPAGAVSRLLPVTWARAAVGCPKATAGQPVASPTSGPGSSTPSPSPSS